MIQIIADIGVNWDGNFDLAKELMRNAKDAACNAVKFQAFEEETVKDHPERDHLLKSAISKMNIETINDLAKSVGIEWFCTPMYVDAVEILEPYVQRFKIREAEGRSLLEGKDSSLFERVLKTGKEVMASSQKSPKDTKFFDDKRIRWLYCVPKYPCDFGDLNFAHLSDFDGYSNHCPHILAPLTAAVLGAKIIEVHITPNKKTPYLDNPVSFDYSELKELVSMIRLVEKIKR